MSKCKITNSEGTVQVGTKSKDSYVKVTII